MAVKSAWGGGGVWGATASKAGDAADYEGEDACGICLNAPEAVSLQPCKHKICEACVARMRYQLISKADNGVTCPFCRGLVAGYKGTDDEGESYSLLEANKAASFAAKARTDAVNRRAVPPPQYPSQAQPQPHAPQHGGQHAARSNWQCPRCRITNSMERRECNQCGLSAAQGTPAIPAKIVGGKEQVLNARASDLIKLCNEKYHPGLNQTFHAAGTPSLEGGGILDEVQDTILAAVKVKGQARLVYLVKTISEARRWPEVVQHTFGSYTMQDLLLAAAQLRQHLTAYRDQGILSKEAMVRALGGQPVHDDMFAMLIKPVLADTWNMLQHEKGFFVLCRLMNVASAHVEIAAFLKAIQPHLPALLKDTKRGGQLHKAAWRLSDALVAGTPHWREAGEGLGAVAQVFLDHPQLLLPTLYAPMSHRLPAQAVYGIPNPASLKLGRIIAESAKKLADSTHGARALEVLLAIQTPAPEHWEAVRDLICLVASNLCSSYAELAPPGSSSSSANSTPRTRLQMNGMEAPRMVRCLISRLAETGEEDWVGWLCCELAVQAKRLSGHPAGWNTLLHGLSQPIMDSTAVEQHLTHIRSQVGDITASEQKLWATRRKAPPQPPLPHERRCAMQPNVTTAPPPPPMEPAPPPPPRAQPPPPPPRAQPPPPPAALSPQQQQALVAQPPLPSAQQQAAPQQQPPLAVVASESPARRSAPVSVPAPPARLQPPPGFSGGLTFGSFSPADGVMDGVGSLAISPAGSGAAPVALLRSQPAAQPSAPASPIGRPPSCAASMTSPAASADSGSAAFDMHMFFPSAEPKQQPQQQPQQAAAQHAAQALPPFQQPQQSAAYWAQPQVHQQQQLHQNGAFLQAQQQQQQQPPQQAQAPFQEQLSWQQQQLAAQQQQQQAQQAQRQGKATYQGGQAAVAAARQAAKKAQGRPAYLPPGAAPSTTKAAPRAAALPAATNGPLQPAASAAAPPQPQPKPAARVPYNPNPANANPSNVPGRLATSALSSLTGSREPVTAGHRTSPTRTRPNGVAPAAAVASVAAPPPPQQQQQQQANGWGGSVGGSAAAAPAAPTPAAAAPAAYVEWQCPVCTYSHAGREAEFLRCAMCASEKP